MISVTFSVDWSPRAEAHPLKGKFTMFGIFKKKTRKAIVEVKKMENRDAVKAFLFVVMDGWWVFSCGKNHFSDYYS